MKRKMIEGNQYDMLYVEKYIGDGKYHCVCDCGKEVDVLGKNLRTGHTTSCGCKKLHDLSGMKFGYLKVIERGKKKVRGNQDRVQWKCICQNCGKKVYVYSDELTSENRKSCGCIRKEKGMPDKIKAEFSYGTQLSKIQSKPTKSNKSGVVGVNWDKSRNKWQASIRFQGKKYNIGRFEHLEDAVKARKRAEEEMFKPLL